MEKKSKIYIETYGCQMNFSDSEIVGSIMVQRGYTLTGDPGAADVIFINTCSIREHAESRVRKRLREFGALKKHNPLLKVGLLGCMAEQVREKLLEEERLLDLIAGPDAYRDLPRLLTGVGTGQKAVNLILSEEETYADIHPVRTGSNQVSAFISIMRGCENFCSYCVVPNTRGVERSREVKTIIDEAALLFSQGYREITLLGQNVNSYCWKEPDNVVDFPALLARVAAIDPLLRLRFATSHPKDLSDELIHTIGSYPNICKAIHLPVQSGSTAVLQRMNRKYSREWYLNRVEAIKKEIPEASVSTDIISGFCGETEEDHALTLSLMREVAFDAAFMFKYSERPGTSAASELKDDVPEEVKSRRLTEIIKLQNQLSLKSNSQDVGKVMEVLVEGPSKRSPLKMRGRNSQNKMIVFEGKDCEPGGYAGVRITSCTSATLMGERV